MVAIEITAETETDTMNVTDLIHTTRTIAATDSNILATSGMTHDEDVSHVAIATETIILQETAKPVLIALKWDIPDGNAEHPNKIL